MNGSTKLQNNLSNRRILSFWLIVIAVFSIYTYRLFSLQILNGETYLARAEDNRTDIINLATQRGIIYDRNGVILARNIPSYNIVLTAANLPDDDGAVQKIYREVAEAIQVPVYGGELSTENPYVPCRSDHGITEIGEYGLSSSPYTGVQLKCDVDRQLALTVQEKAIDWPGISVEIQPIRDYPTGSLTASLIGFLGPIPAIQEEEFRAKGFQPNRDKVGYAGLELEYQDILAGQNGQRVVEVDVGGQILRDIQPPVNPIPGQNIRLTIDVRLQQAAEAIFKKEVTGWNAWLGDERYRTGVIIAMNPQTGEVLAMVSYPSYENNRMARIIPAYYYEQLIRDPSNPLLNHAVGDVLPAGSVFKLVTAVGSLNEGVVTPEQVLDTPPELIITEKNYLSTNDAGLARRFVDWNEAGFGQLDFVHGLANSSNVYFYKLGGGYKEEVPEGLGICRLGTYAAALGYGEAPDIGLPDEQKGLIPNPTWKRVTHGESWTTGDTYLSGVGQGYVLATPIQVLISAAIIANDGKYMQPTLVRETLDEDANVVQSFEPTLRWDLTKDPLIQVYGETTIRGCEPIPGQTTTVAPWVFEKVQEGMRLAVTEGTLSKPIIGFGPDNLTVAAAGKTGTAEYCDTYAAEKNRCIYGAWPSHAWTVAYAPFENPEIAVVAFVYNGEEGATVAGPMVAQTIEAYFELKAIDNALQAP